MSELKRCPFCGGEAELDCKGNFKDWFVKCKRCFCKTPIFLLEHFAIVAWNTRKPMDRIVKRLERNMLDNDDNNIFVEQHNNHYKSAIKIVKEEGGVDVTP